METLRSEKKESTKINNRKRKENERTRKKEEDEKTFKEMRSMEKAKERFHKRSIDEVNFRRTRSMEKEKERFDKRSVDEVTFMKTMSVEKSNQRNVKRCIDEVTFLKTMSVEKSNQRSKKRSIDEDYFKKLISMEKSKARTKTRINLNKSELGRRKLFFDAVREGPIYACICCHRIRFKKGVILYNEHLKQKIRKENKSIIEKAIGIPSQKLSVNGNHFVCLDCKNKLLKGRMPAMSHKNNLQLVNIDDMEELCLTELENCLIARNILFQKFVQLPKSRWTATKDRIVNIPIFEADILKTIETFPRTPDEAGIIPVKLKRKLEYKNCHIEQFISVPKIFNALKTLKRLGNKYYQFIPDLENFKTK